MAVIRPLLEMFSFANFMFEIVRPQSEGCVEDSTLISDMIKKIVYIIEGNSNL